MDLGLWCERMKTDPECAAIADRHYSRQSPGAKQFMPPGQTMVLMTWWRSALFGWWRPHPGRAVKLMNGYSAWVCTIFRNEGRHKSSKLILAAEELLLAQHSVPKDGFITYVWRSKVRSANPGYCFKMAGWDKVGESADGLKDLLQKPLDRIKSDHGGADIFDTIKGYWSAPEECATRKAA